MHFSPFFRTTQRGAGNGHFLLGGGRGWWHGLAAASCACAWLGPNQRRPLSWPLGHTWQPEGAADLYEVGEDAREEQRG
jgi:hypothetical protein